MNNEIRIYLEGISSKTSRNLYNRFVKENSDIISHHSYSDIAFSVDNFNIDSKAHFRINNEFDCYLEFSSNKEVFIHKNGASRYCIGDAVAGFEYDRFERAVYLSYLLEHYNDFIDLKNTYNRSKSFTSSYTYKQDVDALLNHIDCYFKHFTCENVVHMEDASTLYEIVNVFTHDRYFITVNYTKTADEGCVEEIKKFFNIEINIVCRKLFTLYHNHKKRIKELIKTSKMIKSKEECNQILNYLKGDINMSNIIKSVTINDKDRVLTVVFNDKSVYMQKWSEDDAFDVYVGVALCVAKKYFKDNGTSVTAVKKFLDDKVFTMTEYAEERAFKKQKKLEALKEAKKKRQALAKKVESIKKD